MTNVRKIGFILGPVLFFALLSLQEVSPLEPTAWKVLAMTAWMVTWWITEAIPIPVTAILPMVLLPLLQIFNIREATASYADPIIFLFMGGFLIALGLEKHHLHTRIALNLIKITGTNSNGIVLGFMLATAFLSMWISNTAATVMMLPIAMSIIELIPRNQPELAKSHDFKMFALCLMLGVAYAANIGGTATIIGTPPNIVLVGFAQTMLHQDLSFSKWLLIGLPFAATMLLLTFFMLTRFLYPSKMGSISGSRQVVDQKIRELGPVSTAEKRVSLVFGLTALSWIFRSPLNQLIGQNILNDTIIAMTGGILMFIVPSGNGKALLSWKDSKRLAWGILLLFGGGLTLAKSLEEAGIIQIIGQSIQENGSFGVLLVLFLLITVMLFMTELMSNVALATIFIPVVIGIAGGLGVEPLYFAIPVTLASSCAFMMPISTPPNAIVFSSGFIRMDQMVKAGVWLNLISIFILMILGSSIVRWIY
jgi:sodium-dependent dicarboxylate transporter 2/3/5